MPAAQLAGTEMVGWPPGARHYSTDDGHHFAVLVHADLDDEAKSYVNQVLEALGDQPLPEIVIPVAGGRVVPQPTVVIECNADGTAIDMTPLWSYPAGTTYTDALAQAGYDVAEEA